MAPEGPEPMFGEMTDKTEQSATFLRKFFSSGRKAGKEIAGAKKSRREAAGSKR